MILIAESVIKSSEKVLRPEKMFVKTAMKERGSKEMVIITKRTWEELRQEQAKLGELIIQKRNSDLENNSAALPLVWVSRFNAERLKLCLLVEIGEFANEIKSFKAWRKKTEIDWTKAKEELIDCLCFFLDLSNLFQIELADLSLPIEKQALHFNELLLELFYKTVDLSILEEEDLYNSGKTKITNQNTYYEWLKIFQTLCAKLSISEPELKVIYLRKNEKNQGRAAEK